MELFTNIFDLFNCSDFIDTGDILVEKIGSVVKALRVCDWSEELFDFAVNS